jgi:branched-chain amino acid transport system ATP-binding protein
MPPLLEVDGLSAGYGAVSVLRDVGLQLAARGVLGVLGANGAGKSTLMRAIAGLVPVGRGRIVLDGRDVSRLSAAARVHHGIALVPEGRLLFPTLSVWDHLWLGGNPRRLGGAELRARADEVCALFPVIASRLGATAGVLSGGQQQMLAIGRALMSRPRVLLLDEPSMGLGPKVRRDIYAALSRLIAGEELAVVLVEQDASLALRLVERVLVLQGGRVVREGAPDEFLRTESLHEAYLGMATS